MAIRWYLVLTMAVAGALSAANHRHATIVPSLLQIGVGAEPDPPGSEGALMIAASAGNVDAIKELLNQGADVNAKDRGNGQTPLMGAALANHLDAARLLLERGADINSSVGDSKGDEGMTALLFAARDGRLDMTSLLLDRGADIDENAANRTSPLLIAILNGHIQLAKNLLDRGADPNAADTRGRGPLFAAVQLRNQINTDLPADPGDPAALIRALVEKGADVNAHVMGETPFLLAAFSGDVALMRFLLGHGADPNMATLRGTTPLMAAAGIDSAGGPAFARPERDYLEAIELCFESGANINAANAEGLTAMHGAARRGWVSVIQFLADRGAQLDVKDREGRTPLTFAKPNAVALLHQLMAGHNYN